MVNRRTAGRVGRLAWAAAAGLTVGGCAATAERPLTAGLFMPPPTTVATATPTTAAGDDDVAVARPARAVLPADPAEASPKNAMILSPSPPADFESVRPLAPLQPTTAPVDAPPPPPPADVAPQPPAVDPSPTVGAPPPPTGTYMTVGGVLARVNDTPIYAHKVLALLDREFASRARDMSAPEFQYYAANKIDQQTHELIEDESRYAVALKALTADEKKLVDANAVGGREDVVKQAGGSLELARRRAADEGYDFDDLMRQEYRHLVVQVFIAKHIDPQVQVSARDLREFYAANVAKRYADKDKLLFRVIELDPAQTVGGETPRVGALIRAREVHQKAIAPGTDFTALAKTDNDDHGLKATGGDPGGWMDRGAYRLDAVEAALWPLSPGQVTDVVETDGKFYVARLEDKHQGVVKPFEDPAVQADAARAVSQQQQAALLAHAGGDDFAAAISVPDPNFTVAVQMAMQKYAKWNAR